MDRPGTVRRRLAAATVAVAALGLSGCVRLGVELELKPDDVGQAAVVVAVEDDVLEMTGQSAADFIDQLVGKDDPAEHAIRTEEYARDGYTGERYVYGEMPVKDLGKGTDLDLEVKREGDEYVVAGTLDLSEKALGVPAGGSLDDLDVTVDVTFPGVVTSTNGTVDGNTVHWEPPLGGRYEIHARGSALDPSSPKPSPTPEPAAAPADSASALPEWAVLVIGAGGLLILLLLAVVVWQALRVRRREDAAPPVPSSYPNPYPPHPYPPHPYPQHPAAPPNPHRPPSIPPQV